MINPKEIEQVLNQLEGTQSDIKKDWKNNDYIVIKGWIEALKWVLEKNVKDL